MGMYLFLLAISKLSQVCTSMYLVNTPFFNQINQVERPSVSHSIGSPSDRISISIQLNFLKLSTALLNFRKDQLFFLISLIKSLNLAGLLEYFTVISLIF
jgi:hypothetical protein